MLRFAHAVYAIDVRHHLRGGRWLGSVDVGAGAASHPGTGHGVELFKSQPALMNELIGWLAAQLK